MESSASDSGRRAQQQRKLLQANGGGTADLSHLHRLVETADLTRWVFKSAGSQGARNETQLRVQTTSPYRGPACLPRTGRLPQSRRR